MTTQDDKGYEEFLAHNSHQTRTYAALIQKATQCEDRQIGAIESIMRDRFRTLDHLGAAEFITEARLAHDVLMTMFGKPLPKRTRKR